MNGRRADAISRPELKYGSYDIVAPIDYALRKPSKARIIFVLDCSRPAVQSGAFMAYTQAIKEFICSPQTPVQYAHVAIMTFDKSLHFYDLRPGLHEPQTLILTDILDPFVPMNEGLFHDTQEAKDIVLELLDRLPKLVFDNRHTESCCGSAVTAAYEALKTSGGRIVLMQTAFPSYGLGALRAREDSGASVSPDKPHPGLQPQGDFFRELAKKCATSSVSVSIIATPSSTLDLATLGTIFCCTDF